MRKVNIGAGWGWKAEGWDVLDNNPSNYDPSWKFRGKCWDSSLATNTYDIVFCSHMLEHVPHFRLEKTIAEFNRIMKEEGTLRILVPSLRKAAEAYVANDISFFSGSTHYSDHMGIGASFMRVVNSPGGQTVAMSREMDEIIGGYAHLYSFDFQMLKSLLEKWGFDDVIESEPGESKIKELRKYQHVCCDGVEYSMNSSFVEQKQFLKSAVDWHYSGFDKTSTRQLVVEAKKKRTVKYSYENEYDFHKVSRLNSPLDKIKSKLIFLVCTFVDKSYSLAKMMKLNHFFRHMFK